MGFFKRRVVAKLGLVLSAAVLLIAVVGPTLQERVWPSVNGTTEDCPFLSGKSAEEIASAGESPHGPRHADSSDRSRPRKRGDFGAVRPDRTILSVGRDAPRPAAAAQRYSEDELSRYNGSDPSLPLLLAMAGKVHDVSTAPEHYGAGAPYAAFAGRAATRGIVLPSLSERDISDDVADFTDEQHVKLAEWTTFFERKYAVVGKLVPATAAERARLAARRGAEAEAARVARGAARSAAAAPKAGGRVFSAHELRQHDGVADRMLPLLMAVGGHVVDVSSSSWLYGPTAPRAAYAGRAVTRALALQSVDEAEIARGDDVSDFTAEQHETVRLRIRFYLDKFAKVGELEGVDVIRDGLLK